MQQPQVARTSYLTQLPRRQRASPTKESSILHALITPRVRVTTLRSTPCKVTCDDSQDKAKVTCPMATQDAFDVEVESTWTNVTSDNKCQSTLAIYGTNTYCGTYDVDKNNQIQGGAHTNMTFNVLDLTNAMTSMDPNKPYTDEWQYFHNVCYTNKCIGFSVANEGPGNTNMVYYPCLQNDSPTTNIKPPNLTTTNLGTVIVNNASTNCLPKSKC